MDNRGYGDTTVIIPTLNEARNLGELIKTLNSAYRGMRVVVADDASSDGTGEIVSRIAARNANVKLLDRSNSAVHGLTASVLDAAGTAKTKFLVVIDGDLQHPPEKIAEIVEKLRNGADIAIGRRRKVIGKWAWHRRAMSMAATMLARMRLRKGAKDPLSGFFGARGVVVRKAVAENGRKFEREGYKVLFELLKYSKPRRIAEVGYDFGERRRGESKIGAKHVLLFARSLLK